MIPEPVVVSGKALVASSAADAVAEANAQGANLKIIGVRYQKNPYCIMSLAKSPIKTPQDLYGKKLGVAAGDQVGWQTFAKVANLDVSKVTIFPVQYDPTPLADGQIDALVAFTTSEPGQLEVKEIKVHQFLFADYGYAIYSDIYEVTEETLATKEKELVAFMKAEKAGWTYNIDNVSEGTKVALTFAKSSGLSYKQQLLENQSQMPLLLTPYTKQHGIFSMDPAGHRGQCQDVGGCRRQDRRQHVHRQNHQPDLKEDRAHATEIPSRMVRLFQLGAVRHAVLHHCLTVRRHVLRRDGADPGAGMLRLLVARGHADGARSHRGQF